MDLAACRPRLAAVIRGLAEIPSVRVGEKHGSVPNFPQLRPSSTGHGGGCARWPYSSRTLSASANGKAASSELPDAL